MTNVEQRKRDQMHDRVEDAMRSGATRTEAFHVVAGLLGLRAGHVAAAYWRVQRERTAAARQTTIGGTA
jgi:hypothetical protein